MIRPVRRVAGRAGELAYWRFEVERLGGYVDWMRSEAREVHVDADLARHDFGCLIESGDVAQVERDGRLVVEVRSDLIVSGLAELERTAPELIVRDEDGRADEATLVAAYYTGLAAGAAKRLRAARRNVARIARGIDRRLPASRPAPRFPCTAGERRQGRASRARRVRAHGPPTARPADDPDLARSPGLPELLLVVPIEGGVRIRLAAGSWEDEWALRRHLQRRDLAAELQHAVDELLVWLADADVDEDAAA